MLNEKVATILGMPFLKCTNPNIDWRRKTFKIKYKGKNVEVPTHSHTSASTLQQNESCAVPTTNSFAELAPTIDNLHHRDDDVIEIIDDNDTNQCTD